MTARLYVLLGIVAIAVEVVAGACVVLPDDWSWFGVGALLHVVAAMIAWWGARLRRRDLSRVESDLALYTALLVPLFGPALAWTLPRPPGAEEQQNAHAVFEEYSDHVRPALPDYERTLFTGDYTRDLARELDAESYHEVLRHGSTDQKRNALRRLAELGAPHHFALIRKCLLDPSHEVRLYAYSELERGSRGYEEAIAKRAKELANDPEKAEACVAIAQAYFAYAASGIHDEQMAAFYFRSAERYGGQAHGLAPDEPDAVWIRARALARLGESDAALDALGQLTPEQQGQPQSCLVRAELAFQRRDYHTARLEAGRLREAENAEIPSWLAALESMG